MSKMLDFSDKLDVKNSVEVEIKEESEVVLEDNIQFCTGVNDEEDEMTRVPHVIGEVVTTELLYTSSLFKYRAGQQIVSESGNSFGRGSIMLFAE